jgi:hypothetical protein
MKKIMTIAAGVLFSTVVFAGGTDENPSSASGVAVLRNGESTFKLIYKGSKVSDVKITIADARNKLVFSETVRHVDGFLRPYNFSSLSEGEYTITITDESGKKVEKVDYRSGQVTKLVNVKRVDNEGKYVLTAAGKGEERITVNIFDASDVLLYNESKSTKGDFAQVYNLSKIEGPLTFEIIHENGEAKRIKY